MFHVRRQLGGRARRSALAVGAVAGALAVLPVASASAAEMTPILSGQSSVVDLAYDTSGNLYLSDFNGQVQVLPRKSGTLFGQAVTAGSVTTLATLTNVPGIAVRLGDLYMVDTTAGTVSVLAPRATTVFGVSVPADTVTTIASGLSSPIGVAFDTAGNLYVATATGVSVLPVRSEAVFGQAVTRDVLTPLNAAAGLTPAGPSGPGPVFLAFDRAGDLFVSDDAAGSVSVIPKASGTVFGQAVTADTLSTVATGLFEPTGITLDPSGNLYISIPQDVDVLPVKTGTLYGTAVTADTVSALGSGVDGLGLTYYLGHPYLADQIQSSIDELTTPSAHIFGAKVTGSPSDPMITVTGYGFNTAAGTVPAGCSATGVDYDYGDLILYDATTTVQMGYPGDCVGLVVASASSTKIVFTLGSWYATNGSEPISPGDSLTISVDGRSFSTTPSFS